MDPRSVNTGGEVQRPGQVALRTCGLGNHCKRPLPSRPTPIGRRGVSKAARCAPALISSS